MDEMENEFEVQDTARYVSHLSRNVRMNQLHKARLREELMRRHQELSAEHTQRAAGTLWPRLTGLKRLTLVAPPALAAVVIIGLVLGMLQVTGHRNTQAAEAQRLTTAIVRTAPTLTSWHVAVHQAKRNTTTAFGFKSPLFGQRIGKRLIVKAGHTYLATNGKLFLVTVDETHARTYYDWQFGFAELPTRLAQGEFRVLSYRVIDGQWAEGIQYTLWKSASKSIVATAWVDPDTGLVIRLLRDVMHGTRVVEQDWADYRYQRTK